MQTFIKHYKHQFVASYLTSVKINEAVKQHVPEFLFLLLLLLLLSLNLLFKALCDLSVII